MPNKALPIALAVLFSAAHPLAPGTLGSAAVSGTVGDDTGAAVPDAKVVLIETARGLAREATTNTSGAYIFPTISAGL